MSDIKLSRLAKGQATERQGDASDLESSIFGRSPQKLARFNAYSLLSMRQITTRNKK